MLRFGRFMLHAALIGFPSTGKSTLFQLMTSAKDAPRGKWSTRAVGISKVPDPRLDRLTAMFNPKKRVPATIEFTDIVAPGKTGAAALVDVAGYKNADALVHVVRAFRDAAVPHPPASVDPARDAQAMEDELILADLGVVERRLERLEKDLKKSKSRGARQGEGRCSVAAGRARKRPAAARAGARRRRPAAAARLSAALGQAAARRDQPRRSRCRRRPASRGRRARRADGIPRRARRTRGGPARARRSSSRSRRSRPADAAGVPRRTWASPNRGSIA